MKLENGLLRATIHFFNQPMIKEGAKYLIGSVTFAFGIVEIYDLIQIARGRTITAEASTAPRWKQVANKVIIVCAKISLILSAGVSRPGVFLISSIVGCIFSTEKLERVFGPNTLFAINPWHPRHIISILAVILVLPSLAQSAYKAVHWILKKREITDAKIRLMTLFNALTSRPILHLSNRLLRVA